MKIFVAGLRLMLPLLTLVWSLNLNAQVDRPLGGGTLDGWKNLPNDSDLMRARDEAAGQLAGTISVNGKTVDRKSVRSSEIIKSHNVTLVGKRPAEKISGATIIFEVSGVAGVYCHWCILVQNYETGAFHFIKLGPSSTVPLNDLYQRKLSEVRDDPNVDFGFAPTTSSSSSSSESPSWATAVGTGAAGAAALAAAAKILAAALSKRRRPEEDEEEPEDEDPERSAGHLLHLSADHLQLTMGKSTDLEVRVFQVLANGSYRQAKGSTIDLQPSGDWADCLDLRPTSGTDTLQAHLTLQRYPQTPSTTLQVTASTATGHHSASIRLTAPQAPTLECKPENLELIAESGTPQEIIIWIENAGDQDWQFEAAFHQTDAPISLQLEATESHFAKRLLLTDTVPAGSQRPLQPRMGYDLIIKAHPREAQASAEPLEPLERHLTTVVLWEGLFLWSSMGTHGQDREIAANDAVTKPTRLEFQAMVLGSDGKMETNPAALNLDQLQFGPSEGAEARSRNLADAAQLQFTFEAFRNTQVPGVVFQASATKAIPGDGSPELIDYSALLPGQREDRFSLKLPLTLLLLSTEPGSEAWQVELDRCTRIIEAYIPPGHQARFRDLLAQRKMTLGAEGLYELRRRIWSIAYELILAKGGEGFQNEALWADRVVSLLEWTQWGADLAFGAVSSVALGPYAPFAQQVKTQITSALVLIAEGKSPESWLDLAGGNLWDQLKSTVEGKIIDPDMISKLGTDKKALIWAVYCTYYFAKGVWYEKKSIADAALDTLREVRDELLASFLGQRVGSKYPQADNTKPADPSKPVDPVKPTDPLKPSASTQPANPSKPTQPSKPAEPAKPVQPTKTAEPPEPAEPTKPTNPASQEDQPNPSDQPAPSPPNQPTAPKQDPDSAPKPEQKPEQKPAEKPEQKPEPKRPTTEERNQAWKDAQRIGKQKVAEFQQTLQQGSAEEKRAAALEIQADKQALWEINRSADDATKQAMNAEMQKIYTETDQRTKIDLALELNAQRQRRIAEAEKAGNQNLVALLKSAPEIKPDDISVFNPTNPSATIKVGADRDVTMRYPPQPGDIVRVEVLNGHKPSTFQYGRVNADGTVTAKNAAGEEVHIQPDPVDVPHQTLKKAYEKHFYETATGQKAPPSSKAVEDFAKRHDQACTDRLHPESYGRFTSDLETAMHGPGSNFSDSEQVGQAMSYKGQERFKDAETFRNSGDHLRAETELAEGMRQMTKQWNNQVINRRTTAQDLNKNLTLPPVDAKLQKAIDIMNEVGSGKTTPAQAELNLQQLGYTPSDVAHDVGKQVELLQKLVTQPNA